MRYDTQALVGKDDTKSSGKDEDAEQYGLLRDYCAVIVKRLRRAKDYLLDEVPRDCGAPFSFCLFVSKLVVEHALLYPLPFQSQ